MVASSVADLPDLVLERVADMAARIAPTTLDAARLAAELQRASRRTAEVMAPRVHDAIDRGCVAALRALREKRACDVAAARAELDEPESAAQTPFSFSSLAQLKAACVAAGCTALSSCTKAQLLARLADAAEGRVARRPAIARVLAAERPIPAHACPLRPRARDVIVARMTPATQRPLLTAAAAREAGARDLWLAQLPLFNVNISRRRLYSPVDVAEVVLKYRGPGELEIADMALEIKTAAAEDARVVEEARRRLAREADLYAALAEAGVAIEDLPLIGMNVAPVLEREIRAKESEAIEIRLFVSEARERAGRRRALVDALSKAGCVLRRESDCCNVFVRLDRCLLKDVVTAMRELKFYDEHTDFKAILSEGHAAPESACPGKRQAMRYDRECLYCDAVDRAKGIALQRHLARFPDAVTDPEMPPSVRRKCRALASKAALSGLFVHSVTEDPIKCPQP
jgi:hypothetical protein